MAKKITEFKTDALPEGILGKLEDAAIGTDGLSTEQPYFFVFLLNPDVIHELAFLAGDEEGCLNAPCVIAAFAQDDRPSALQDSVLAFASMKQAAEKEGLGVQNLTFLRCFFNDARYNKIKEAIGVPHGFSCALCAALGYPLKSEDYPVRYDRFSYVHP